MHFFEVLTLSLETGRNLAEAIEVTTDSVSGNFNIKYINTKIYIMQLKDYNGLLKKEVILNVSKFKRNFNSFFS